MTSFSLLLFYIYCHRSFLHFLIFLFCIFYFSPTSHLCLYVFASFFTLLACYNISPLLPLILTPSLPVTSTSTSIQNGDLRTTLQQQSSALEVLQKSEKSATALTSDLTTEKSLLLSDKQYLQSEIRNLEMKFDEKARENERNECAKFSLESKVRDPQLI